MDLRKIEYFLQVAECLSFAKAAEEIHISHQAMSKQIRLLEEEIGAPLFERTTAKVSLTEVGRKMYSAFAPAVKDLYQIYNEIENYIKQRKSRLVLGYFNALSYYRIVDPIVEYIKSCGEDLSVNCMGFDVGEARKRLMEDQMDVPVTFMVDPDEWKSVKYFSVCRLPMKILVSKKHPWYQKETITKEDVARASLLVYESGSNVFMKDLPVEKRIGVYNYDSYNARLSEGKEFGVIVDIYSRREGDFKLLDLPEEYRTYGEVIAAFKKQHPLLKILNKLEYFTL